MSKPARDKSVVVHREIQEGVVRSVLLHSRRAGVAVIVIACKAGRRGRNKRIAAVRIDSIRSRFLLVGGKAKAVKGRGGESTTSSIGGSFRRRSFVQIDGS